MSEVSMLQPIDAAPRAVAAATVLAPMAMISRAIERGAGIETLERLMALQERWEASEAARIQRGHRPRQVRDQADREGPYGGVRQPAHRRSHRICL